MLMFGHFAHFVVGMVSTGCVFVDDFCLSKA